MDNTARGAIWGLVDFLAPAPEPEPTETEDGENADANEDGPETDKEDEL